MTLQAAENLERDGFAIVPEVLDALTVAALIAAVGGAGAGAGSRRRGSVYALRNLLEDVPAVTELADSPQVRALVVPALGPDCFPVRGILFDKTPEANWNVVWHQDLSIAVREAARWTASGRGRRRLAWSTSSRPRGSWSGC